MPQAGIERTVRVSQSDWIGYLEVDPPLDSLEQYEDVCAAAYDIDYARVPKPNNRDFEQSLYIGATELRFVKKSEAELREAAARVVEVLTVKHQLPARFDSVPA